MAEEVVILVVRDPSGNAKDLAELITGDIWAVRTHDPKLLTEIQAIKNNTDQLEGFTDGIEGLLTSIRDNADQVETLLTSLGTNTDTVETLLAAIRDNADGVEALLTALGTNTDSVEGLLTTIRDNADQVETALDNILKGQTGLDTKFDYGGRTDANPVRVGKCPAGAADATPHVIFTFTWDTTAGVKPRPTKIAYSTGSWA